jgi:hypothetical protein
MEDARIELATYRMRSDRSAPELIPQYRAIPSTITQRGARTPDHTIKSRALYRLS